MAQAGIGWQDECFVEGYARGALGGTNPREALRELSSSLTPNPKSPDPQPQIPCFSSKTLDPSHRFCENSYGQG